MAKIDRTQIFPKIVEDIFIESWPGFAEQKPTDRAHLAMLLCSAFRHGKYSHHVYEDCISYPYRTRDEHFGRGRFQSINGKLGLFEVEEWWLKGSHTKGYSLTPEALFLMESVPLQTTQLVDTEGTVLKTPATEAIASRDINGNNRRGKGQISAVVSVGIEEMLRLLDEARQWRWHYKDGCAAPDGRRFEARLAEMKDNRQRIDWLTHYCITPTMLLILRADTAIMPKGHMEITYCEHTSGRLYAVAGVMQTAPREVRAAAFSGCFDFDIENCHFDLVRQLAERLNIDTPAIDDYLIRKSEIRREIADDLQLPIKVIKQALIAIIYGASKRLNSFHKGGREMEPAMVRLMGIDKAAELFAHPLYLALHREVKTIRKPIIEAAPKNRQKIIINPFGKGISIDESPEAQLAHIVQGAEALILDSVIQRYGQHLQLLMHDGWISNHKIDIREMSASIFQDTGYQVALEVKTLS